MTKKFHIPFVYNAASGLIQKIASFLVVLFFAKKIGPDSFNNYVTQIALLLSLKVIHSGGFRLVYLRAFKDNDIRYLISIQKLNAIAAIFYGLIFYLFQNKVFVFLNIDQNYSILFLMFPLLVLNTFTLPSVVWSQFKLQFDIVFKYKFYSVIISLAALLLFRNTLSNIASIQLFTILILLIPELFLSFRYKKIYLFQKGMLYSLRNTLTFHLNSLIGAILEKANLFALSAHSPSLLLSSFERSDNLLKMPTSFLNLGSGVITPYFSKNNEKSLIIKLISFFTIASFLLFKLMGFYLPEIVLGLYGGGWSDMVNIVEVMCLSAWVFVPSVLCVNYLNSQMKPGKLLVLTIVRNTISFIPVLILFIYGFDSFLLSFVCSQLVVFLANILALNLSLRVRTCSSTILALVFVIVTLIEVFI
ncbi:MAG: hypothetical protein ACON5K_01730 [Bacteroidia bacterium]